MAEGEGERIGLVLRRHLREREQNAHHVLDLSLFRPSGADHGELDRLGAVLVHLQVTLEAGAERGAPGLAQLQGRSRIAGEYELLHRHLMWTVLLHHAGDAVEDHTKAFGPRVAIDADSAAGDALATPSVRIDHPEPGGAGARIDAEYTVAQLGLGLHLFPLVRRDGSAELQNESNWLKCRERP